MLPNLSKKGILSYTPEQDLLKKPNHLLFEPIYKEPIYNTV